MKAELTHDLAGAIGGDEDRLTVPGLCPYAAGGQGQAGQHVRLGGLAQGRLGGHLVLRLENERLVRKSARDGILEGKPGTWRVGG